MAPGTFDFFGFSDEVAAVAISRLRHGGDAATLCALTAGIVALAEQRLAAELTPHERSFIACRSGCGHCCRVHVSILPPEAVAIARFLHRSLSAEALTAVTRCLEDSYEVVRWMDDEERRRNGIPCPFLATDQSCGIYPFRPLACRGITSMDPEACAVAMAASSACDDLPVIVQNITQLLLMKGAYVGYARGLTECGLDGRGFELSGAVLALVYQPVLMGELARGSLLALT